MQDNQEKCKELAIRIYNLDEEVYKCVGSSLGRTFTGQKETTIRHLAAHPLIQTAVILLQICFPHPPESAHRLFRLLVHLNIRDQKSRSVRVIHLHHLKHLLLYELVGFHFYFHALE